MGENIAVKASLEIKEIRRFSTTKRANVQEIKERITKAFPFLKNHNSNISLSWTDHDGDRVSISSNSELEDAIKNVSNGVLKLNITLLPEADSPLSLNIPESSNVPERSGPTPEVEDYHQSFGSSYNPILSGVSNQDQMLSIEDVLSIGQQPSDDNPSNHAGLPISDNRVPPIGYKTETVAAPWPCQECTALNRINVKPNFRDIQSQRNPSQAYQQCPKNGKLIIIKNNKFPDLPAIDGLDHDSTCLSDLFKKLRFEVKTINNSSVEKIKKTIDSDREKTYNLYQYGCYIVVVLSKCDRNVLYDSKGDTMELWELTDRVHSIKELEGKPKIFIVEGYNGNDSSTGESTEIKRVISGTYVNGPESVTSRGSSGDQTDATTSMNNDDDVFLLKCNTYGKGNPYIKGSVFVQALVDVLCERAYQDSFEDIINQVTAKLESSNCQNLALPFVTRKKLLKQLYFYPE